MKIITVASLKGGIGKTTTALYLSQALRSLEKKILLIDLDQNNNLSNFMIKQFPKGNDLNEKNILNMLKGYAEISEFIWESNDGIDLIPAKKDIKNIDVEFATDPILGLRFRNDLKSLKYDFIIIDAHPATNTGLRCAILASDEIICPVEPSVWSSQGIDDIEIERQNASKAMKNEIKLRALISKCTLKKADELKPILKKKGYQVFQTAIVNSEAIKISNDISEFLNEKTGKAFPMFVSLAKEILK